MRRVFSACGPVQEKEPNDSYQQATVLKPGKLAKGTIANPKDQDWYRIDAVSDGTISAKLGGIKDVDFVLAFFDKDRRELKRADETTVGGDEQLLDLGVSAGTYFLVVSNNNEKSANAVQIYGLETKLDAPAGREREANDSALTAQVLEAGGFAKGHYWPAKQLLAEDPEASEEDWYSVAVAQSGLFLLNVDVSEVPKVDAILEVYDTNGYKLKELDAGGIGEGESLRNFGVRGPGKFSLRLRSKLKSQGNPDVPYDLTTELLPYQGLNEFEPNDQRADATPLERESISGTIAPAGDQDWFKVSSDSGTKSLLRAELSGLAGMDLTLSLRDGLGNEIAFVDNMGKEQPEVMTGWGLTGGDWHVVVMEKSGKKSDSRQTYALARKVTPWQEGLEWEPNNSSGTVQTLKVGESVDGYFAPKGDEDWYEFNLYQKSVVVLELPGVINVAAAVTLFDQEYTELAAAKSAKPGEPAALERELDRGTYVVRLAPGDAAQNNVRDKYSFRVRVK
ncbi:MAG: hypothetical protein M0D55_17590 [Elusimicrobiota bacterium]|nr:MAG: hypothetical protein M0D55_17590 [Elusimicrobiota bacterium]